MLVGICLCPSQHWAPGQLIAIIKHLQASTTEDSLILGLMDRGLFYRPNQSANAAVHIKEEEDDDDC
jgi:hypothetical protein